MGIWTPHYIKENYSLKAKITQESLSHVVDRAGLTHYFRLNHLQLYMSSICNLEQTKTEINKY